MTTGIYQIRNIVDDKRYYGSAINIVAVRWPIHKHHIKNKAHHSKHLENAWYQYGEDKFVWEIVEECPVEMLLEREQYWLDTVRVKNSDGTLGGIDHSLSYNICPTAGSPLGIKRGEETRQKISETRKRKGLAKGEKHPLYNKFGKDNPNFGSHRSEETREKMKMAQLGKRHSEETKQKISEIQLGISWAERMGEEKAVEAKKKQSECHMGHGVSGETREKISLSNTGKHPSSESRQKMSQAHIGLQSGENHPRAKLNWEKVGEIREQWLSGDYTYEQLGEKYGVDKSAIGLIIRNKNWIKKGE